MKSLYTPYYKKDKFKIENNYAMMEIQVSKFTSENLDVITVYRSSRGSIVVLKSILKQLVEKKEKAILITGDFNICYMTKRNNEINKELEENGFHQLMQDASHIQGGHIDHVYWRPGNQMWKAPIIERHSPYYSDHDASLVTLTGNILIVESPMNEFYL